MKLTTEEIMEFLTDPVRRPLLNWTALETAADLPKRRINEVHRYKGSILTEEEIDRLVEVLGRLETLLPPIRQEA